MRSFTGTSVLAALLLAGALAGPAAAEYATVQALAASVQTRLGTTNGRLQEVADGITIRAKRITGVLMPGAEALYDGNYNQLLLEGKLIDARGRVKDLEVLTREAQSFTTALLTADTVYHELAHAEWDLFIEESADAQDAALWRVLRGEVIPWIRVNEPAANAARCATEWHGYFVGALVNRLLSDWSDFLTFNGLDPNTLTVNDRSRGFVRTSVQQGKVAPADFGRLVPEALMPVAQRVLDEPYWKLVRSGLQIEVVKGLFRGNANVDCSKWTPARGFKDEWWVALFDHLRFHHLVPATPRDLLERQNRRLTGPLAGLRVAREAFAPAVPARPLDLLGIGR